MAQQDITRGLGIAPVLQPPALAADAVAAMVPSRWTGLLPWQARRVRDYIDGDLHGRPSIKDAARHVRLSPGYFSRCFRQSFGETFSRFVARQRIERAQGLMLRSSSSLCQIALACGFTDQAHFTRTFGGVTGSTPSKWRRTALGSTPVKNMASC